MKTFLKIIGIIFLVIFAAVYISVAVSPKQKERDLSKQKSMNVSVGIKNGMILVKNQDTFDYEHCSVSINNEYNDGKFLFKAGEVSTVAVSGLSNKSNMRFNPITTVVKNISLFCDNNEKTDGFTSIDY